MATTLSNLLLISKNACEIISELILPFYLSINSETSKLKSDKSVFTIADGIVQYLLTQSLFKLKLNSIIGEEDDSIINIISRPYFVDDLIVPEEYYDLIDSVRIRIEELSNNIDSNAYLELNVFIDPIDGTREFSTG